MGSQSDQQGRAGGFFRLYRRLFDHPIFNDVGEAGVFAWMISLAAWRPVAVRYKARSIELQRGQFAMSTRDMAARIGWSEAKVRRFLDRLENSSEDRRSSDAPNDALIDAHHDAGVNVITIRNYSDFQFEAAERDAAGDALSDAGVFQNRRTEQRSKERKKEGEEGGSASRTTRGTRLPEGALLPEDWKAWAHEQGLSDPQGSWDRFHDHFVSAAGQRGVKSNWQATWRNWVRTDLSRGRNGNGELSSAGRAPRPSAHGALFDAARVAAFDDGH